MKFEWDLDELNFYANNLREQAFENAVLSALKESGDYFLNDVRVRTPVDTGNLRADWSRNGNLERMPRRNGESYSLYYENKAINARGGTPTMYPSFVEEGYHAKNGRWIPGRWFQKASELKTAERTPTIIKRHLTAWIERGEGGG